LLNPARDKTGELPITGVRRQPLHSKRMASQLEDAAWLEWITALMGMESRQTHSAALPPGQFHCLLDELPLHLISPRQLTSQRSERTLAHPQLFLNPQCSVLSRGQLPSDLEANRHSLKNFYLDGTIAWVRDSAANSLHPFWLGPRLEAMISGLRPGEPAPPSVSEYARILLSSAGILIPEDHAELRLAQWSEVVRQAAQQFQEQNYAPLANLIHPFNLAALRRYYRHAIRQGSIVLGDEQSSRRYVVHNESVARFFHHQLATAISAVAGQPVKPSYVYLASYLSGAELKKHIDRQQCEFSVTLCLDFSPEPKLATPWPIRLDTTEGSVTAYQALGDSLVYRGTRVPHYRDILPQGHTSTSIFFHYVPADFSGQLD